mmetsp:Transcript_84896/g.226522  ORF Transcript_84896/g.226522 Transcript_84896/m.226522 type:complete len:338 (+) Transcript_84896:176-1189(+)
MITRRGALKREAAAQAVAVEAKAPEGPPCMVVKKEEPANVEAVVEEDLLKSTGDEIFSVCEGSQDNDTSPAEIGDYDLNYLNIYQPNDMLSAGCNNSVMTILPEAVPPLSLCSSVGDSTHVPIGPLAQDESSASVQSTLGNCAPEVEDKSAVQPDTPPRQSVEYRWIADASARGQAIVVPAAIAQKMARAGGRKRGRAGELSQPTTPRGQRNGSESVKSEPCDDKDSDSDSDRGMSPGPMSYVTEVFEIRPEDDPHGLFSRDPATLTLEEQRLVKKQRRLLKNRESAQLSRHRKKMHLNALEKQVGRRAGRVPINTSVKLYLFAVTCGDIYLFGRGT